MAGEKLSKDAVMEASIKHELESLTKPHVERSIYKVPEHARKQCRNCYQPSVVSIGPYHHKNQTFRPSKELKLRYLQSFLDLDKFYNGNAACTLGDYITDMRSQEQKARNYYEENLSSFTSDEFTKMLLVDASFIIILFMDFGKKIHLNFQTRVNMNKDILFLVQRDLFLQENQIPFFVLERLYNQAFCRTDPTTFRHLARTFIYETFMNEITIRNISQLPHQLAEDLTFMHLLDFLRVLLLPQQTRNPTSNKARIDFPQSTTLLKAAGIKFKKAEGRNLLDITFSENGTLEIPPLKVTAITEDIFRNIIFFEIRHYDHNSYFMSYVFFIDELIDNPEDVLVLEKAGIIDHWLGSDHELATVFNRIAKNVSTHDFNFYYAHICKDINDYATRRFNRWKAILKRQYFNHPWSTISVIYLVILLILTILQVITGFLK